MEETQDQAPAMSPIEPEEDAEINHTDKLVGVFSEPGNTFAKISKFPIKTSDWFIPVLILIVVMILSQIVMMSNPAIKADMMEKQMETIEKRMDEAVANGQMTREQADQQMDTYREAMGEGGAGSIIQMVGIVVGIPIVVFIFFFLIAGIFYLTSKFALGGDGTFKDAMVAYGLPYYILIIQTIVLVIAALAMNKMLSGTSVADFMNIEKTTFGGFLLGKLDIFSIWFYAIISIGFAKMFKSQNTTKYLATIFGMWIGFSTIFFFLAKAVPFLSFLNR